MPTTTDPSRAASFAASILEASSRSLAAFAARDLLDEQPEIAQRFSPGAEAAWQSHFAQRLLELAAALDLGIPRLFASRMEWSARAFRSRDLEPSDLATAFESLAKVLREEVPEPGRAALEEYLAAGAAAVRNPSDDESALDPGKANDTLALEYLLTVLEGDPQGATRKVVAAVDGGLSIAEAYLQVLVPAQREVGRMWHRGELGISEEHLTTATTRRVMSILAERATPEASNGKTLVAAAVAGNAHGLGIRIVSDFFAMAGWRALCLGADLPPAELADAVRYFGADLVVLSATLSTQLRTVRETIEHVRQLGEPNPKILVGGMAFHDAPDLWKDLGADGTTFDAAAVELGGQLVGLSN